MSNYLSSRLEAAPAISIGCGTEVTALHGCERFEAVTIREVANGTERTIDTRAAIHYGRRRAIHALVVGDGRPRRQGVRLDRRPRGRGPALRQRHALASSQSGTCSGSF